jgi:hypothetical protein
LKTKTESKDSLVGVYDDSDANGMSSPTVESRVTKKKGNRTLQKKQQGFCEKVFSNITAGFFTIFFEFSLFRVFTFFPLGRRTRQKRRGLEKMSSDRPVRATQCNR